MIADGTMDYHLGVTLLRIFAGFALAAVTGIALGVLMGMSRIVCARRRSSGSPRSIRCRKFR